MWKLAWIKSKHLNWHCSDYCFKCYLRLPNITKIIIRPIIHYSLHERCITRTICQRKCNGKAHYFCLNHVEIICLLSQFIVSSVHAQLGVKLDKVTECKYLFMHACYYFWPICMDKIVWTNDLTSIFNKLLENMIL